MQIHLKISEQQSSSSLPNQSKICSTPVHSKCSDDIPIIIFPIHPRVASDWRFQQIQNFCHTHSGYYPLEQACSSLHNPRAEPHTQHTYAETNILPSLLQNSVPNANWPQQSIFLLINSRIALHSMITSVWNNRPGYRNCFNNSFRIHQRIIQG